jgi:hypothetical protein
MIRLGSDQAYVKKGGEECDQGLNVVLIKHM